MNKLLSQIKHRRVSLGLKQADMQMRVGISRQQYQYIESKGNPRLDTLELVAQGLNAQLMLIPTEKIEQVKAILDGTQINKQVDSLETEQDVVNNPWQGLLGEAES